MSHSFRRPLAVLAACLLACNAAFAQLPPLEGRVGLQYAAGRWSAGSLLRLAREEAAEDRRDRAPAAGA